MQRIIVVALLMCFVTYSWGATDTPKREFRATWLTTVTNIDWPKSKINPTVTGKQLEQQIKQQKTLLNYLLNQMVKSNLNATCFQVRSMGDAMYNSSYEPWSSYLTGTRGAYPGYDPLEYAVEAAHARGLELHVWINPFRYEGSPNAWGADDPVRKAHPDWLLSYKNDSFTGTWFDPGNPDVRAYLVEVIREIVKKYDIDGVIFDDYFYPYGGTTNEDAASVSKYKPAGQSTADWRRENIDKAMKAVYDMIQQEKPWVRFGIGPSGIWTMNTSAASKYGVTLPAGIRGMDAYTTLYCNTLEWMKGGYVDYVAPQIYWKTDASGQWYGVLAKWWSEMAKKFSGQLGTKKVHFFGSHASYKKFGNAEMGKQIDCNRQYDKMDAPGSVFYNTTDFVDAGTPKYLAENHFSQLALPPAMDWKKKTKLGLPTDLQIKDSVLVWNHRAAPRFTIYAIPEGVDSVQALTDPAYLLGVSYAKEYDLHDVVDLDKTLFAVRAYDRYGNEYEPAYCRYVETGVSDVLSAKVVLTQTFDGVQVDFEGEQKVEIYTVNGMLVNHAIAQNTYTCSLPQGVYFIRVGNAVKKFVR